MTKIFRRTEHGELVPIDPAPQGRPTKLTPERHDRIVELVKHGNTIEVAAAATGIDQRSYYHWMAIGKAIVNEYGPDSEEWDTTLTEHQKNCGRLFQAIRVAASEAEATAVLHLRSAMPKHWQAALAWLERRHPDRWKRRDELITTNPLDGPSGGEGSTIDESAVLNDPEAVTLMHEALELVSKRGVQGALEATGDARDVAGTPFESSEERDSRA